jgi:phosphohistidine phosphatase
MKLYIVRHAWAGERDSERWPDDELRPLTEEGKKRFNQFVKRLLPCGFKPARIATSPLVRCRQTAELLLKHLPAETKLEELDALRPDSLLDALLSWTNQGANESQDEAVAWVGHAPDVGRLAASLVGGGASIRFSKGAVAEIRFETNAAAGEGELAWLATAKLLDC